MQITDRRTQRDANLIGTSMLAGGAPGLEDIVASSVSAVSAVWLSGLHARISLVFPENATWLVFLDRSSGLQLLCCHH